MQQSCHLHCFGSSPILFPFKAFLKFSLTSIHQQNLNNIGICLAAKLFQPQRLFLHWTPSVMFSFCSSLHSGVVSLRITEMQFSKSFGQNCVAFNVLTLTKFLKPPTVGVACA